MTKVLKIKSKNFVIWILVLFIFLFFNAGSVLAQNHDLNPITVNTFGEIINRVMGVILWFALIMAPIFIIIGGLMFSLGGANPTNIVLGKKIILYTTVILGILLITKALTSYFKGDLTF